MGETYVLKGELDTESVVRFRRGESREESTREGIWAAVAIADSPNTSALGNPSVMEPEAL